MMLARNDDEPSEKKYTDEDGDAFERRRLGSWNVGKGDHDGESDDQYAYDVEGGFGPVGVEGRNPDRTLLNRRKEKAR